MASGARRRRLEVPRGTTGVMLASVAANGELYVAVGDAGTIAHSSDGNRWVEASFSATEHWLMDIVWGDVRFVAVGAGTVVHSSDGDRWQSVRPSDWSLRCIAWGREPLRGRRPDYWIQHRWRSLAQGAESRARISPGGGMERRALCRGRTARIDHAQRRRRPLGACGGQWHGGVLERRGLEWRALRRGGLGR